MQLFYQLTRAKLLFFLLRSCSNGNISHRHTTLEPDRSFVADCYQLKKIRRHRNGWVAKRGRGCLETPWKRPQISETSKNFTIEQHARATIWKLDKCQFMHRWCMPSSVNSSILHKLLACASVANLNIILAPRPIYNSALVPIKGNTAHRAQQDQQPEHDEREKKATNSMKERKQFDDIIGENPSTLMAVHNTMACTLDTSRIYRYKCGISVQKSSKISILQIWRENWGNEFLGFRTHTKKVQEYNDVAQERAPIKIQENFFRFQF